MIRKRWFSIAWVYNLYGTVVLLSEHLPLAMPFALRGSSLLSRALFAQACLLPVSMGSLSGSHARI
jgi:hypothetical protein